MSTFADLSTLLLTFFVLLLSFANMDVIKFQDMQGSLKDAFGYREDNLGNFHPEMIARRTKVQSFIQQTNLGGPRKKQRQMKQMIRDLIQKQEKKNKDKIKGGTNKKGMIIRVDDSVFFAGGNNRLKPAGFPVLDDLAKLLQTFPCDILIAGHTDDTPIYSRKFPSNWELSAARGIAVMRYLVEVGGIDPTRIGAAGYGEMRPLVPNDTKENRLKNRRVEFICHEALVPKTQVYKTGDDLKALPTVDSAEAEEARKSLEEGDEDEDEDLEDDEESDDEEEDEDEEDEEEDDEYEDDEYEDDEDEDDEDEDEDDEDEEDE